MDFIRHIVEVSEVMTIHLKDKKTYSFTVTLDNGTFVNITRAYQKSNSHKVYKEICHFQKKLLSYTVCKHPRSV